MDQYEKIVAETQDDFDLYLSSHPIVAHVVSGQMTTAQYVGYLRETYHMVRHTPRMLALAAARCEDERRGLRNWFIEQTDEENGHDLFCIKDIRHVGQNPDTVLSVGPMPGAWGLICQNYFMATYGNPAGILGVASITEGLGASIRDRNSQHDKAVRLSFRRSGARPVWAAPPRFDLIPPPAEAQMDNAKGSWCGWSGSNRHSLRNGILSPARLPVSPHPRCGSPIAARRKCATAKALVAAA